MERAQMLEKKIKKKELMNLLEENYYTLSTTGAEAMASVFDDYSQGRFTENLPEWGISSERLLKVINEMFDNWLNEGKMDTRAIDYRKKRKK
jgi:hypothetical protein